MAFVLLAEHLSSRFAWRQQSIEPPDSIPNSEVKRCIADGSVGFPHVRVGHRQASKKAPSTKVLGVLLPGNGFSHVERSEMM